MDASRRADPTRIVFRLNAISGCVRANQVLDDPRLSRLVVEDSCWALAREDWHIRRPPWWHVRRTRAWRREGFQLMEERETIAAAARRYGF